MRFLLAMLCIVLVSTCLSSQGSKVLDKKEDIGPEVSSYLEEFIKNDSLHLQIETRGNESDTVWLGDKYEGQVSYDLVIKLDGDPKKWFKEVYYVDRKFPRIRKGDKNKKWLYKEKRRSNRIEKKFRSENQKEGDWSYTMRQVEKVLTEYRVKNEDYIDQTRTNDKFTHSFNRERKFSGVIKRFNLDGELIFLNQYELLVITDYSFDIKHKSEEINSNYILTGTVSRWDDNEKKTSSKDYNESYLYTKYKSEIFRIDESSSESDQESEITTYHTNGKAKSFGTELNGKLDGRYEEYSDRGELIQESKYFRGSIDGKYRTYYPSGSPKEKGVFINGQKKGVWITWHENKQIKEKLIYENGELHGKYVSFHDNGESHEVGTYEYGKKIGEWLAYHPNQKEKYTENYSKGLLTGRRTEWYENGKVKEKSSFKNGLTNGKYLTYHDNGQKLEEGIYSKGSKSGVWKEYYDNTKLKESAVYLARTTDDDSLKTSWQTNDSVYYDDHMRHGEWNRYYLDGTVAEVGVFEKGKLVGTYNSFWPNGNPQMYISFDHSDESRLFKYYFENGVLKVESIQSTSNQLMKFVNAFNEKGNSVLIKGDGQLDVYYEGKFRELTIKDSLPNGIWKVYKEDKLVEKGNYLHGFMEGAYYLDQDSIQIKGEYSFGQKSGKWSFIKNNLVNKEIEYVYSDSVDYIVTEYYDSGLKKTVKAWKNEVFYVYEYYDIYGKPLISMGEELLVQAKEDEVEDLKKMEEVGEKEVQINDKDRQIQMNLLDAKEE